MRNSTLLFLVKKDNGKITDVCLAMKKRGFGVGRWNGVGGKVIEPETVEDATKRETMEEICVKVKKLNKVAELSFSFPNNPAWDQLTHVYTAESWIGEAVESEEMMPQWYSIDEIPFDKMWPDDIFWLPRMIAGELVRGEFSFGEADVILSKNVEVVEKL